MKRTYTLGILISVFLGSHMDAQNIAFQPFSDRAVEKPQPQATVERTETEIVIHHPGGAVTRHPREDAIRSAVTTTWKQIDDGNHSYEFDIDTRDAYSIRYGWLEWDTRGTNEEQRKRLDRSWGPALRRDITPPGWYAAGPGWSEDQARAMADDPKYKDDPTRERLLSHEWPSHREHAKFSFVDYRLPGPIPVYVQGYPNRSKTELPHSRSRMIAWTPDMGQMDTAATFREQTWQRNSRKHLVIGPAIEPDITEPELRQLIWLYAQEGISIVADLPKADDLATALDQLQPATDFERQVIDCLRTAVARAAR